MEVEKVQQGVVVLLVNSSAGRSISNINNLG